MIVPLAIRRLDHAPHHPGHATTPRKHLASVARGYLAPVGGIVLATFLGQIVTTLGYGAYFPWAVPALYAGIAGVRTRPGTCWSCSSGWRRCWAAAARWRRADQTR